MTTARFNPISTWRTLSPAVQERIGAAIIAHAVGAIGTEEGRQRAFDVAAAEAECLIRQTLIDEATGALFDDQGAPYLPDLRPLGIRQCRVCGCTDWYAYVDGCHWAGEDLCSTCADGGEL